MPFPDPHKTLGLLGLRAKDRITGLEGIITSVCHDLYGCVQASLHSGLDKDGQPANQHWYDVNRLIVSDSRVMNPPEITSGEPLEHNHGPAEKPASRSV